MKTYYSVTAAGSSASGLPEYIPGSGVRQVFAWPAVLVKLNESWIVGAGAYYQRLTDGAANSQIVEQGGDSNHWTYGLAVGYAWN